ncbi:MAG: hypothetical protein NWS20_02995, partial [Rickettsiaceae bacterium]|nr:hypothetical protein [Rickettsiaceae bacterium]
GAGTLEINANAGDYDLLNATAITFAHADSLLKLTNTSAADRVVTLKGNVVPGVGVDLQGSLEINSNGTNKLDLKISAAETIGTDNAHRLKELIVSGNKDTQIDPAIFAETITISSTAEVIFDKAIDSGAVSTIAFTAAGNTTFNNNVTVTQMAFGDNARVANVAAGKVLKVKSITSGAGNGSELVLAGNGSNLVLAGAKTVALDTITVAAAGATNNLGRGSYTVANVALGNATGTLELADNFKLTGAINLTAGSAGNIRFLGNGKVTGDLGSAGNAVGVVTVDGVGKTLQLGGNVNATSLNATAGNAQNLKFINAAAKIVAGTVGNLQSFDQIEFSGGGKLTFGAGGLTTGQALHFSANTEVVTDNYDLGATNVTNAIGVNGNKLTVNADQAIAGNIGAGAHKFGELHVDAAAAANRNVSIDVATFFAGVTGAKAKVIFNA